jgi:CheY-like chemotaxis protein
MFDPFFSTKAGSQSSGLGLAVVYGIVKNHDGYVFADSELGEGTVVHILLPRVKTESAKKVKSSKQEILYNRILLVDDEKVIREVGRRMLEKGGYEVIVASNGYEALDIYRKEKGKIDLVLVDLIMPGMGGRETQRRLKMLDPSVRLGFTSGYGPKDKPELLDLGEKHYIQKPFQTEVLLERVRFMLGKDKR